MSAPTAFWHGGFPGLKQGDELLPPDVTGTDHTLSEVATAIGAPAWARRRDVVYVTSHRAAARVYAAMYPDGALYRVTPVGELEPDPDAPDISFSCARAVVEAVADPVVLLRSKSLNSWMRSLGWSVR